LPPPGSAARRRASVRPAAAFVLAAAASRSASGFPPAWPAAPPARPELRAAGRWCCAARRAAGLRYRRPGPSPAMRQRWPAGSRGANGAWSEPRIQVDLKDIGLIGRTGDVVGAQPAQARIDLAGDAEIAADDEAFEIGPPEPEVGVGEAIDHGIGFEIFVAQVDVPVAELLQHGTADLHLHEEAGVAAD